MFFRTGPAEIPTGKSLLRIALICKYWYNLIVSTPTFWNVLGNETNPASFRLHLSHAGKNAPIRFIRTLFTRQGLPSGFVKPILAEFHRLEEFKTAIFPCDIPLFLAKVADAASLKDLELVVGRGAQDQPKSLECPDISTGGSSPPFLRTLSLSGIRVPWTSPLLSPNLTSLCLDSQVRFQSYRELHNVFHVLRELKSLVLHECLPPPRTGNTLGLSLDLPKLRFLTLRDDVEQSTRLLCHLRAALFEVNILGNTVMAMIPPMIKECIRLVCPIPKPSPEPSSHFCAFLHLAYRPGGWKEPLEYRTIFHKRGALPGTSDRRVEGRLFVSHPTDSDMEAIIESFPLEDATVLDLDYSPTNEYHFWFNVVAEKMPSVERLNLGETAYVGFMKAYGRHLDDLAKGHAAQNIYFTRLVAVRCYRTIMSPFLGLEDDEDEECTRASEIRRKLWTLGLPDISFT
ncbi:hypothetical protein ONZ45_g3873 [Pleurotus djamor]|nr:hypothetical protein ONZ45_g3873 [Pleurotus djamor]